MRVVLAAVAVAAAAVPSGAFAVDYLTADQAAKLMFPEADSFEPRERNANSLSASSCRLSAPR